jgi:two-component system response regulator FixJ
VIAIIDDDESVRQSLHELLRSCGYGTEAFASAEQFLSSPQEGWDVVVSDVSMPRMSGLELAHQLAARPGSPPIVLMSADPSARARRLAMAVSVDFLLKPFGADALLECVRDVVIGRRRRAA